MEAVAWGVLVAARLLPGLLLIPAFGGHRLPIPALLGLCGCAVAAVFDATGFSGIAPGGLLFVGLLLKELCVGAVLALSGAAAFEALRLAGQLIDDLRGSSQGQVFLPQTGEAASPLATLYLLLACLVFFQVQGPARLLAAARDSFLVLPVDRFWDGPLLDRAVGLALSVTSTAIEAGVRIAWPVAVSVLGVDLLLGFVNRAAPQIQVFFLGMPLRAALGILVAALGLEQAVAWFAGG